MPDARISELPAAALPLGDADLAPLVQASSATSETRRATIAQLRDAVLADRGLHVRDYGARGDGTTDDAPAFQAAIDALKAMGGGTLLLGPRNYRIASPILVDGVTVRLQGAGFTEGPGPGQGSWLVIDTPGFTPLTFTGPLARGSAIRDIAVRQIHGAALNENWAPTAHDWVVRVEDCYGGIDIDNLLLSGVNKGIYCRNSGRLDIRRLRGQVFACGVEIDQCYDVPRLHSLHFWPFWSDDSNVLRWTQAHGDALVFRRTDGVFIDQAFALGYRSMFRFAASADGVTTKFYIGQAYVDFCKYGVWIEGDGTDGQIANLTTQGEVFASGGQPLAGSSGLYIGASNSRVQIGNLRVDTVEDNPLRLEGSGNRLDLFALRCVRYNSRSNGAAAIHLADSGAAAPNTVYLGSPPLLEGPNPGPLTNTGSNGILAMQAPAGRAGRPGLMLGGTDTGLFAPASGTLAGAAGGTEVLRATAAGTVTLGGMPGSHALEVTTPLSTANHLVASGSAAGGAVSVQAQGADANISLALVAKGSGALLASLPDGTAAGGAARGMNAVDWQQSRDTAAKVASGTNATIGGGRQNTASGSDSTVAGGAGNSASAPQSAVGGGLTNFASGNASVVAGGSNNTANETVTWIPGGSWASSRATYGRGAWGSGFLSVQGDAQAGEFVLRRQGTDATQARLTSNNLAPGANNSINLPNGGTYMVRMLVVARQVGGNADTVGDSAGWIVDALVRRGANAATTVLVGGGASIAPTYSDAGATAWRLAVAADTANGGIAVSGTGEANKIINWVARVMSVEVVG
ncbi:MAG: glycosyl hydrolase family 28-related protein [Acetobacteraceae bacterium]|nr:glycosyl hydrolase family 28-related protein [Acetobacteraceae bacterium]